VVKSLTTPILLRLPLHGRGFRVLELQPIGRPAAPVRRPQAPRYYPLKPHLAGVLEDREPAIVLQVLFFGCPATVPRPFQSVVFVNTILSLEARENHTMRRISTRSRANRLGVYRHL
jgi:hypothetical protein